MGADSKMLIQEVVEQLGCGGSHTTRITDCADLPVGSSRGHAAIKILQSLRMSNPPPSPTTTNGAHRAGCALRAGPLSIIAIMASRCASARVRPVLAAASMRVVSATAASETTGQCETRRARLPA